MKQISFFLISLVFSFNVSASEFLGVFTTDTYPVYNCKITKSHNELSILENVGKYNERANSKDTYLEQISQISLNKDFVKKAKKMGFNAIIGYRYYVHGGFDGYGGRKINGSVGFGVFRAGVMGNFVLVKCK